jgi:hypothetical protein
MTSKRIKSRSICENPDFDFTDSDYSDFQYKSNATGWFSAGPLVKCEVATSYRLLKFVVTSKMISKESLINPVPIYD